MPLTNLTKSDFRAIPFSVGGWTGTSPLTNAPIIKDAADLAGPYDADVKHKHLVQINAIPLSYKFTAGAHVGQQHIGFGDPTGTGGDTEAYYLPFKQQNITSMVVGNACDLFFTDNLSGCTMFVDAKPGQLVVYHANVFGGQFNAPDDKAGDYGYERPLALIFKKQMHDNAMAHYPGTTNRLLLSKSMYWAKANGATKRSTGAKIMGKPKVDGFGTTVCGFRNGNVWDFWWQTWSVNTGNAARVIDTGSFGTVAV